MLYQEPSTRKIPASDPQVESLTGKGRQPPYILAIASGKGGAGKSFLAANIGICLARLGREVILFDADLGGANLHTWLGLDPPKVNMGDFISRRIESLTEALHPTDITRLRLIGGTYDVAEGANPYYAQKMRVLRALTHLDADFLILDLGAGCAFNTLDFYLQGHAGLLVTLPDLVSVENIYRFIRSAFFRRIYRLSNHHLFRTILSEAGIEGDGALTPADLVKRLAQANPQWGELIEREAENFTPMLIVNQVHSGGEGEVGHQIVAASQRFIGFSLDFLGNIAHTDLVLNALRKRRAMVLEYPYSTPAQDLQAIALRILRRRERDRRMI